MPPSEILLCPSLNESSTVKERWAPGSTVSGLQSGMLSRAPAAHSVGRKVATAGAGTERRLQVMGHTTSQRLAPPQPLAHPERMRNGLEDRQSQPCGETKTTCVIV